LSVAIELSKTVVEGVQIEHVDISNLPLLNTDLEKEGTYPAEVEAFRQKILGADSILFASPEYNYSVSGKLNIMFIMWGLVFCFCFSFQPLTIKVLFDVSYSVLFL
jgi:multimeric flavodoxin WrbA